MSPMVKPGIPRKIKHGSYACTVDEFNLLHLVASVLHVSPSALIRLLVQQKYQELQDNLVKNLELSEVS